MPEIIPKKNKIKTLIHFFTKSGKFLTGSAPVKRFGSLFLLLVLLVFSSCGILSGNKKGQELTEKDQLDFAFNFFEASRNKMLGNTDKALNHYLQCIRIDGRSDVAMYEAALLLEGKNKPDNALIFIEAASHLKPENVWYALSYAELLQKNRKYDEAIKVFEKLIKKYPDRVDFYFGICESLLYANRYMDALKMYDKVTELIGLNKEVTIQKEKIWMRLGKLEKAVAEIQKLIDAEPLEPENYGLLAELYQANGMQEKALETLNQMEKLDPANPYMHLSKAEYYRNAGDKEKSFSELKQAFMSNGLDIDVKIDILGSYVKLVNLYPEMNTQAMELNRILIATHPEESRSYAVYGDFLYFDKKYEEARVQYRKALDLNKQSLVVWQQLMICESELKDYVSLEKESNECITLFPNQPLIYYFNGFAKIQIEQIKEAVPVLNSGVKLVIENDRLLSQFYSSLGDAHYRLKEYSKSDSAFNKALVINPKDVYVLNNYSYYLSVRGDSLDKAEKMSLLSNQLEPDNSSFQDTYGWILYKQEKYSDAKLWVERAMASGGETNPVVLEHYGDILWKLQMQDKALEYWKKAGVLGKGSEFLNKKIAEKNLFE